MLGLGGYPLVSLAEARDVAFAHRKQARAGGDPLTEKRHAQHVPTVEEAAAAVLEQQLSGWRHARYEQDWPRSLRAYAFPRIGAVPVSDVTTADVLAILTPIWHDKPETARRVRQRIGAVMKWAVAMGYRPDNPAGDALGQVLGRQRAVLQHMRALPHGAVADALATVRTSRALVTTKDAFELLVLTAARSGEVRLATWNELDLDAAVWTIPAARMKAKRDHRVPLSGRALDILHDARRPSDGTGLVFRSPRGKSLSDMTLSKLIKELGIAAVPHGFRSSFRDWAAEQTNTPREVVEAALAHTVRNPTEAAYARSDLFERRRRLMDDYMDASIWTPPTGKGNLGCMGEQIAVLYPACSCRSDSRWPRWNQPTRASFWARALLPRRPFRLDGSRSDLFAITPLSQPCTLQRPPPCDSRFVFPSLPALRRAGQ